MIDELRKLEQDIRRACCDLTPGDYHKWADRLRKIIRQQAGGDGEGDVLGGDDMTRAFWHCRRYVLSAYTVCCAAETDNQGEARLLRIIDKGIAAAHKAAAPTQPPAPGERDCACNGELHLDCAMRSVRKEPTAAQWREAIEAWGNVEDVPYQEELDWIEQRARILASKDNGNGG